MAKKSEGALAPTPPTSAVSVIDDPVESPLMKQIRTDVSKVSSEDLATFYVRSKSITDRLDKNYTKLVVTELKSAARLLKADKTGSENQHYLFKSAEGQPGVVIQVKKTPVLKEEELKALLKTKKLPFNLVQRIQVGEMLDLDKFGEFLQKHKAELEGIATLETVVVDDKVGALVQLGKITSAELASVSETNDTLAVLVEKPSKK